MNISLSDAVTLSELTCISRPTGDCYVHPNGRYMVYYESIDKWIVYEHHIFPLPKGNLPGTVANRRVCKEEGVSLPEALKLVEE